MTQHDAAAALRPLGFDDARRRELRALGMDDRAAGRVVRVDRGALHPRRIHRAAAMVWESGATPVVVLTKADLAADERALFAALTAAAPGVDVIPVAAATGAGVGAVAALAAPDRTLCLVGESGGGKSTLVNALLGDEVLATGRVRRGDDKGRHTTTARHLLALPGGGAVIDTPGICELGLWGTGEGVTAAFADVEAHAAGCRFSDCRHEGEPGCAVRRAEAEGLTAPGRVDSMLALRAELEATERRRDERARRRRGREGSRMVREALRAKGRGPGGRR